jgi:hypothetical protein
MSQKSILEQALLQVQTLEEAVKQNAKGILASTMKQELNDLLREQEEDEDETEVPMGEQPEDEVNPEEEEDVTGDEPEDEETSINDEPSDEEDEIADEPEADEEGEIEDEEFGTDKMSDESDDDVVDMTSASDDEVLKVFKAMKPEDGIVVKKEGDKLSLSVDDQEYIIKLDGEDGGTEMGLSEEESYDESFSNPEDDAQLNALEEEDDEDGTVYEVTLDEDEIELDKEGVEEPKKVEATEAARNSITAHGNKNGMNRSGLPSKKVHKAGSGVFGINEEVETLKKQNSEYKKALVLFKEKLNEVAVFNANLAYATRLFTEHSTTKQEKLNILKRFDSISSINEAKNLYKSIKTELDTKKPMTESVVEKISLTPQTSSTEVLSESKAYENPQFRRMKDLMSKIK